MRMEAKMILLIDLRHLLRILHFNGTRSKRQRLRGKKAENTNVKSGSNQYLSMKIQGSQIF